MMFHRPIPPPNPQWIHFLSFCTLPCVLYHPRLSFQMVSGWLQPVGLLAEIGKGRREIRLISLSASQLWYFIFGLSPWLLLSQGGSSSSVGPSPESPWTPFSPYVAPALGEVTASHCCWSLDTSSSVIRPLYRAYPSESGLFMYLFSFKPSALNSVSCWVSDG